MKRKDGKALADRRKSDRRSRKETASVRKLNIKKMAIAAVVAVVAIYFIYVLIWQQIAINSKNEEIERLNQQVISASEESEKLKQEVENLNDPEYLEKVARERLGLVRPNERVFVDSNKSEDNKGR